MLYVQIYAFILNYEMCVYLCACVHTCMRACNAYLHALNNACQAIGIVDKIV